jgi:hypothetical protein
MLNHEYIVMQMSKARQEELLRERQNDRLAQVALNEVKARLQKAAAAVTGAAEKAADRK